MKWAKVLLVASGLALSLGAFEVSTTQEEIPEAGTFTRTRVADGKTAFSFIIPNGWTPSMEAANKVFSIQSTKLEATFNLRLSTNAYPATLAKFKEQVSAAYSDVKVNDEFTASCGSGGGHGLEITHVVAGKFPVNARVAVFPAPDGSLEVSLSSPSAKLDALHPIWVALVNSLRVEANSPATPKR